MDSKITSLALVLFVALIMPSAEALKCYSCSTLERNNDCGMLNQNSIVPSECSIAVYNALANQQFPTEIKRILEFPQHEQTHVNEWICAKLVISGMNNGSGPKTNYTIRTCLPKVDRPEFCEGAKTKVSATSANYQMYQIGHCSECKTDACNSASSMSLSLLPLLGLFILSFHILKA